MIILLVAAWIILLSLVAGLCAAARVGDLQQDTRASAPAGWERRGLEGREPTEHLEVSTRANVHAGRRVESGASLLRSGGIAA